MLNNLSKSLTTLWQALLSHWRSILVGFVVFTAFLGVVARLLVPAPTALPKPQLPITEPLAGPVEVEFTGNPQLPNRLPLLAATSFLSPDQIAAFVAEKLNLTTHPQVPGLYVNTNTTVTLSQPEGLFQAEYFNSVADTTERVTLAQAQELALAFLQVIGFPTDQLQLQAELTRYFTVKNLEEFIPVEPAQAQMIELVFVRSANGYPLVLSSTPTNQLRLMVTSRGVLSSTLVSLIFATETRSEVALMTMSQILAQVKEGDFLILGTLDVIDTTQPENGLAKLKLTEKEVEYRLDPEQKLFLPFVHLAGTATLRSGETTPIDLTTPAITTVPTLQ